MEAIIDKAVADGITIDAILAENDSTALGVVGCPAGQELRLPVPLSGQDGDPANLQNVAAGHGSTWTSGRTATSWARSPARPRSQLCAGTAMADLTIPDGLIDAVRRPGGRPARPQDFVTPGGNTVKSFILQPTPVTAENLQLVIDGGWITKDDLCERVDRPGHGAGRLQVALTATARGSMRPALSGPRERRALAHPDQEDRRDAR